MTIDEFATQVGKLAQELELPAFTRAQVAVDLAKHTSLRNPNVPFHVMSINIEMDR